MCFHAKSSESLSRRSSVNSVGVSEVSEEADIAEGEENVTPTACGKREGKRSARNHVHKSCKFELLDPDNYVLKGFVNRPGEVQ